MTKAWSRKRVARCSQMAHSGAPSEDRDQPTERGGGRREVLARSDADQVETGPIEVTLPKRAANRLSLMAPIFNTAALNPII
jgi:hypothetical protein